MKRAGYEIYVRLMPERTAKRMQVAPVANGALPSFYDLEASYDARGLGTCRA